MTLLPETETFRTLEISDPLYERDGLRTVTVHSRALGRRGDVTLWVPAGDRIGTLLILLHGVYGSHWAWALKGGVHHTARHMVDAGEIAPMVIAMPSDGLSRDGSGYLAWPASEPNLERGLEFGAENGAENVEQWIADEVPAIARAAAPALIPDAKIAIAGLSMGGYGALRLGSKYPERFCAISAHSAITDIEEMSNFTREPLEQYLACAPRDQLSVAYWMRRHRAMLPPLRFDCGTEDGLIEGNRTLHHLLTREQIAHEYTEFPGGHAWPYWRTHVAETLRHAHRHSRNETAYKVMTP